MADILKNLQNLIIHHPVTVDTVSNLDRPAVTFQWACIMPERLQKYGKNMGIELGKIDPEYVSSCDVTFPLFSSVDTNSITYSRAKYLGSKKPELGTLSIEFYESYQYPVFAYFNKWNEVCCSKNGTFLPLKAKVGHIYLAAFDLEKETKDTPQLICSFYVIPVSNLSLKFNGDSDRQKPKFDFKILHYSITNSNNPSMDGQSINDIIYNTIGKYF